MKLIESGAKSPSWNMEADQAALENVTEPFLRFYEWEVPSITYGYFVDPWEFFHEERLKKEKIALARRPTGGGIIFHQDDLAFSLVVPSTHPFYTLNSLPSYQKINRLILQAISLPCHLLETSKEAPRGGFCMAKPTHYDILFAGKKVGGAAQRKTKRGLLHQVSLCLKLPDREWLNKILKERQMIEMIYQASFGLGVEKREEIKQNLIQIFLKE